MQNESELEERRYLADVRGKMSVRLEELSSSVCEQAEEIDRLQTYLREYANEIDNQEKVSLRLSIKLARTMFERFLKHQKDMEIQYPSPYFGRVDFVAEGQHEPMCIYIGLGDFSDGDWHLVYDWRAPISSLFYDYEQGPASYEAPAGEKKGVITLKRQYRIRDGHLVYMFNSSLNINDDILQEALSQASSNRMKTIIATIQKEQNAIIRDDSHKIMLIQGVAGSGKTSIALHRVAYLLYRYKDKISSENILILSPNKVFGNYISNVLPELGEGGIAEIEMENLAYALLRKWYSFQGFYEQVDELSHRNNPAAIEAIRFKSTLDFAKKLESFMQAFEKSNFVASDIRIHKKNLSLDAVRVQRIFATTRKFSRETSVNELVKDITDEVIEMFEDQLNEELSERQQNLIYRQVYGMFPVTDPMAAYGEFLKSLGREDLIPKTSRLEYADVFPLLYVMSYFRKLEYYQSVQHLIIDEMQDYTPIQYVVLQKLFKCKMTILGDSNQAVNPHSSTTIHDIKQVFPDAFTLELRKSYRSTYEIMSFVQRIIPDRNMVMMRRHGDVPELIKLKDTRAFLQTMHGMLKDFRENKAFTSLGIICKNQGMAQKIHAQLKDAGEDVRLVQPQSTRFPKGVMVVSAHMAKGLEFDQVIVPHADATTYSKEIDKYLLYVACTRAMHKLTVLYQKKLTPFLDREE